MRLVFLFLLRARWNMTDTTNANGNNTALSLCLRFVSALSKVFRANCGAPVRQALLTLLNLRVCGARVSR